MTQLYFSRVSLRQDNAIQAIAANLLGEDNLQTAISAKHRLVWSLFSGDTKESKDKNRDFLWREDKRGTFFILSTEKPRCDFFNIESKAYAPELATGDRLAFTLRANPVVSVKQEGQRRGKRQDVVMHALRPYPAGERATHRNRLIVEAGTDWLQKQGERYGFTLLGANVDGYLQHRLPRKSGKPAGNISTLDFEGVLEVSNPELFVDKLALGFGSAKAFGNGLMLIRRA